MLDIHHVEDHRLRGAYDDLYNATPIRHTDSLYKWILRLLRPLKGRLLLDIACGQGRLVELAAVQGVTAYGSDISYTAVHASSIREKLFVCNGQDLPFPINTFDYITNIGSLEHYVDPVSGVREIARVLRPDGVACILLPNIFGLFSTVLFALHTGRLADDGQPIQRYATRHEWQDLLEGNGLKVRQTVKYECEWPTLLKDWRGYMKNPKQLVRLFLTPLLPLNLANSFVYLCSK